MKKKLVLILVFVFFTVNFSWSDNITWNLKKGFNFKSLNLSPDTPLDSQKIVDENIGIKSIFRFNSSTQSFEYRTKISSSSSFGDIFSINEKEGYIIECSEEVILNFNGNSASFDTINNLHWGFNLISFSGIISPDTAKGLLSSNFNINSIFNWNYDKQNFEFLIRTSGTTIFGDDFNLEDNKSYFISYITNKNPITYLNVSNYSSNHVTINFLTDKEYSASILYGVENSFDKTVSESSSSKLHSIDINSLTANTSYNYKIDLGNSLIIDLDISNPNTPLLFNTTPDNQTPVSPLSLGGKVIDESGTTIEGAIVYIWKTGTYSLSTSTNSNGIFLVDLSNFKDNSTGGQISTNDGDEVFISVITEDKISLNNKYILSGGSPYESGIYTVK